MLFNSLPFLYLFLPVTYLVFWRLHTRFQRYVWLTITGYVFYSFCNPKFCVLMALSTAVSYGAGLGFLRWTDARRRRGEWKTCRNLMITMLRGGLWHGANWTFVAWGHITDYCWSLRDTAKQY